MLIHNADFVIEGHYKPLGFRPSGKGVRLPTLDIVQRKFDPSGAKKINVSDSCYFNCSGTLKAE